MKKILSGKVWKYGDNINTDLISPPQYMELSVAEASRFTLNAVDPTFAAGVRAGDIVVAGANFGSGSSRETSPLTLKYLGVGAVVAKFFARIFYRNAINVGIVALECLETDRIAQDDVIEIHLSEGIIVNKTKNESYPCSRVPEHLFSLLEEGGLVAHLKKELTVP